MEPHIDFKRFAQGKNCAVCDGAENVHTMRIVVNNQDMMTSVCHKATCRGTAHRNGASIDVTKTAALPSGLQHVAKKMAARRQSSVEQTKTVHTSVTKHLGLEEAAAKHTSTASMKRVTRTNPHITEPHVRKHALRPAPTNCKN